MFLQCIPIEFRDTSLYDGFTDAILFNMFRIGDHGRVTLRHLTLCIEKATPAELGNTYEELTPA